MCHVIVYYVMEERSPSIYYLFINYRYTQTMWYQFMEATRYVLWQVIGVPRTRSQISELEIYFSISNSFNRTHHVGAYIGRLRQHSYGTYGENVAPYKETKFIKDIAIIFNENRYKKSNGTSKKEIITTQR